ncbi:MAG: glutamyl-tRNA reductase [Pseudomonadales bacterium]|nr:glutamyl-tRNA reductase [Pseudomonadales bacterium]
MPILAYGISFRTAPIELRERIALPADDLEEILKQLIGSMPSVRESAILSTCNRVEIYCAMESPEHLPIQEWLSQHRSVPEHEIQPVAYFHWDQDAAVHMMRVASGLDSQALGEPQIMGQIKNAYQLAQQAGTLGPELSLLSQFTLNTAKKVRTDTDIGKKPISVAYAAVALARQIFSDLANKKALLIGAGETIELVVQHLKTQGMYQLSIANRTRANAEQLANTYQTQVLTLDEIPDALDQFDIVISSTGSANIVLDKQSITAAIQKRKHKPIFMVDIAVPRDIDPTASELDDVFLYGIDDLTEIIEENMSGRRLAAEAAEILVQEGAEQFLQHRAIRDSKETLMAFRSSAEAVQKEALTQALKQVEKGDDPVKVIKNLARTLTNKLIHSPTLAIRKASANGESDVIETVRKLYGLTDDKVSTANDIISNNNNTSTSDSGKSTTTQ